MVRLYGPNVRVEVCVVEPLCDAVRVVGPELEDPAVIVAVPVFLPVSAISES
jgi:hypothetical protein